MDGVNSFKCVCRPAFEGTFCESPIDPCITHRCFNQGHCVITYEFHNSSLASHQDSAHTRVPQNQGPEGGVGETRMIKRVFARCECEEGFEGSRCERVVDWCGKGLCSQGSTCVNLANQFKCLCPQATTGALCDIPLNSCQQQAITLSRFLWLIPPPLLPLSLLILFQFCRF